MFSLFLHKLQIIALAKLISTVISLSQRLQREAISLIVKCESSQSLLYISKSSSVDIFCKISDGNFEVVKPIFGHLQIKLYMEIYQLRDDGNSFFFLIGQILN
jgi:hypothetical protein